MAAFNGPLLFNYEMDNEVYNKLGDLYSRSSRIFAHDATLTRWVGYI